jgi:hypothetical protein
MAVEDIFRRSPRTIFQEKSLSPDELAEKAQIAKSAQIAAVVLEELRLSMSVDTFPDVYVIEQKLLQRNIIAPGEHLYDLLIDVVSALTKKGDDEALEVESLEASAPPDNVIPIERLQSRRQDTPHRSTAQRIGRALRPALLR